VPDLPQRSSHVPDGDFHGEDLMEGLKTTGHVPDVPYGAGHPARSALSTAHLDAEAREAYLPLRVGRELRSAGGGVIPWSPEASQVDEAELRARIRELCSSGRMPRELPTPVAREVGRAVTEPRVQILLQAEEHCSHRRVRPRTACSVLDELRAPGYGAAVPKRHPRAGPGASGRLLGASAHLSSAASPAECPIRTRAPGAAAARGDRARDAWRRAPATVRQGQAGSVGFSK